MKIFHLFAGTLAALVLTACGGSYTVNRMAGKPPEILRSVAFAPQSGNSAEVTGYVSEALAAKGIEVRGETATSGFRSEHADAVVSYIDVWRWDLVMYLQSIKINLYNASSGALLVSGRWEDSLFHTFYRGESISRELIARMLAELNVPVGEAKDGAVAPAAAGGDGRAAKPAAVAATRETVKPGAVVSRHEYAAREQARQLACQAQEVLSVEGLGSSREELTVSCGDGRRMTIVCRTGAGCS